MRRWVRLVVVLAVLVTAAVGVPSAAQASGVWRGSAECGWVRGEGALIECSGDEAWLSFPAAAVVDGATQGTLAVDPNPNVWNIRSVGWVDAGDGRLKFRLVKDPMYTQWQMDFWADSRPAYLFVGVTEPTLTMLLAPAGGSVLPDGEVEPGPSPSPSGSPEPSPSPSVSEPEPEPSGSPSPSPSPSGTEPPGDGGDDPDGEGCDLSLFEPSSLGCVMQGLVDSITGAIGGALTQLEEWLVPDPSAWGVEDVIAQAQLRPPVSIVVDLSAGIRGVVDAFNSAGKSGVCGSMVGVGLPNDNAQNFGRGLHLPCRDYGSDFAGRGALETLRLVVGGGLAVTTAFYVWGMLAGAVRSAD